MRVALIDPRPRTPESVIHLLKERGDDVLTFATANDALATIEADTKIDALIASAFDVEPFSGPELCREARRLAGKQRPMYVLLMSSSDRRAKIAALNNGADDIIEIPPPPDELLAKLRGADRLIALQRSATTDYLSGVYNRGAFFGEATEACRKAHGSGSLAVILADIDHLKKLNDHHGHDVGDNAIRAVASVAQRDEALVGRLGGDEFSILLKGQGLTDALQVAARFQQRLAEVKLEVPGGGIRVTCSLGVSELRPGDTIDDLMKRADLALYHAKERRNCVTPAPPESSISKRVRKRVRGMRLLPRPSLEVRERRTGLPPSEGLLARVCAVVDLLVASGLSDEHSIHIMAQRLMAAGIPAPRNGQAANWWHSIAAWKATVRNGVATDEALKEYQNLVAAIESIPTRDRIEYVLENEIWNRRRIKLPCHRTRNRS